MPLRTPRERAIQTLSFEAGGLLFAVPVYAFATGGSAGGSVLLLVSLVFVMVVWSPLHNTVFDWIDLGASGRLASDRPHPWRIVHAASHEATSVIVTLPVIMWIGGHGFWAALAVDIGLTLFYAAYAYVFHLAFDHLWPMTSGNGEPVE